MHYVKQLFKRSLLLLPALLLLSVSAPAFAASSCTTSGTSSASKGEILSGAGEAGTTDCTGSGVTDIASAIIQILSIILGIVAIVMIIIAGFKYVTSNGDSGKVSSAKNTLIYALVGIVIASLAQFFVHFALNATNTAVNGSSSTSAKK